MKRLEKIKDECLPKENKKEEKKKRNPDDFLALKQDITQQLHTIKGVR